MEVALKNVRLGLRNSHTRIAFRYGASCLSRCPQLILEATVEVAGGSSAGATRSSSGRLQAGYSGDCLPPGWFDKTPGKGFEQQIDEMLQAVQRAIDAWSDALARPRDFFSGWLEAWHRLHDPESSPCATPLLASFGLSLVERAVMDALARHARLPLFEAVRADLYRLRPAEVHPALRGIPLQQWLPQRPASRVHVRHTVGLGDPLTDADVSPSQRLHDGFPQTLEEYVRDTGIRYFKIKVSNQLDQDLERLRTIAELVQRRRGEDYAVTLDGNEQYKQAGQLDALLAAIQDDPSLASLWRNTLWIEQPLDRSIALDPAQTEGIRALSEHKPVIIDESDGTLDAYPRALRLGYRGVSSKNCKGPVKSLLNRGLTWLENQPRARDADPRPAACVMSAEDLCTVGIVPVQSDLCLVALLGLDHVERNGHHFHPGLSYLPDSQQEAALACHGDLYTRHQGRVAPRLVDGSFQIGSLQCPGFGFAVLPDMDSMVAPEDWQFASLGLDEPA